MTAPGSHEKPPAQPQAAATTETTEKPVAKRKCRRWLRRLGFTFAALIVLLLILVAALPMIASTPSAVQYGLSIANGGIRGRIDLQRLSLSWFGPTEIDGVRITDGESREVLSVSRVRYAGGLWGLALAPLDLGRIEVDSPQVVLYVSEKNEVSLRDAFAARSPTGSAPRPADGPGAASDRGGGALPEVRGSVAVRNGSVKVIRADGATVSVKDLTGDVALDTLDQINGKLSLVLAEGGKLSGEWDIRQLVSGNRIDPAAATGTIRLVTDEAVQLAPLAAVAGSSAGLDGTARLSVEMKMEGGALSGEVRGGVKGLQTRERAASEASPIDAELVSSLALTKEKLTARTNVSSQAGTATADLSYARGGPTPSVDDVLSAVLTGKSVALPELSLDATAKIDLAALGRAVPGLLNIREGQRITAGSLEVSKLSVRGGATPAAGGSIELKGLAAEGTGGSVQIEPVTLAFDAGLKPGQGLEVALARLTASFANVSASGTAANLQSQFQCDLSRLQRDLGQIFELGSFTIAGNLSGTLEAARPNDSQVNLTLAANVEGARFVSGDTQFELARGTVQHKGRVALDQQRVTRIEAESLAADLNGEVSLDGKGWYDVPKQAFRADVNVKQADLKFLAARAAGLGATELARYGGAIELSGSLAQGGGGAPLVSNGTLTAQGLTVDGKPLSEAPARLDWTGVEIATASLGLKVASAKLASALASLDARNVSWRSGEKLTLAGDVQANADLAPLMRAAGAVARMEKPPAVGGKLNWSTSVAAAEGIIALTGQALIDQFEVGAGDKVVRERNVQLAYDGKLDPDAKKLTITKCDLASAPLTAGVTGTIDRFDGECVLALSGRYDAAWEPLMALLYEFAPATAELVVVSGKSASAFELRGPASAAGAQPAFRGLQAGVDVSWQAARVVGVEMGAAKLSPALKDGELSLPPTRIAAADGAVNLGGAVDFRPADPTLRIPGSLALLDKVPITPILGSQLLSRINPIFLRMVQVEGRVSLAVADVAFPFGDSMKTASNGRGTLDLSTLKVQPDALMTELLALGGMSHTETYTVKGGTTALTVKEGRIHYDDFTLLFPNEFDLKFRGSVGLDETLDLIVSIPIREQLLAKLGVRGPTAEYVKMLAGSRIDIPLVGTREQPRLDFGKVDTKKLLQGLIRPGEPEKAVEDLLRGLGGGGKQDDKPKPKKP